MKLGLAKILVLSTLILTVGALVLTVLAYLPLSTANPEQFSRSMVLSLVITPALSIPTTWWVVRLIQEAEASRRFAERMAVTDALTEVFNRRHFFRAGLAAFSHSRSRNLPLSVLLLDIDHFKSINDRFGHAAGDEALKLVARTCAGSMRNNEIFARFGGEEFVALLPGSNLEEATVVAERLRTDIENMKLSTDNGAVIRPTVSIGIAALCASVNSFDGLLSLADEAMYAAKHRGRNQVSTDPRLS